MKLNIGMEMDESQARKMLGCQQQQAQSFFNYSSMNSTNLDFSKDFKFAKEADFNQKEFPLTQAEEHLQKLLQMDNNTVDLLNENYKLKEILRFHQGKFSAQMAENQRKFQE